MVVDHLPAVVILWAAAMSVSSRSPAPYAVVAAGLLATFGEVCGLGYWFGRPIASVVGPTAVRATHNILSVRPWSYLVAAVALVTAVVAWWRQDRTVGQESVA